jgi:hypothetical protein
MRPKPRKPIIIIADLLACPRSPRGANHPAILVDKLDDGGSFLAFAIARAWE